MSETFPEGYPLAVAAEHAAWIQAYNAVAEVRRAIVEFDKNPASRPELFEHFVSGPVDTEQGKAMVSTGLRNALATSQANLAPARAAFLAKLRSSVAANHADEIAATVDQAFADAMLPPPQ